MDVLNKRFDTLAYLSFPHLLALIFSASDFIARQRFAKHRNKWTIPRKKNRMCRLFHVSATGCEV